MHGEPVRAAGLPSMSTVVEPIVTVPRCCGGAMNGSLGCRPTWGGVLNPDEPCTAAGLPAIRTLVASPWSSGAENGRGGDGDGAPTGLGIRWIAHTALMRSPMTAAGVPISPPLPGSVELDRRAFDLDRAVAGDGHLRPLQLERGAGLELELAAGRHPDGGLGLVERDPQALVTGEDGDALVAVLVEEHQAAALLGDEAAALDRPGGPVDEAVAELGLVDTVPEAAQDIGASQVALLEADQDLVVDLGEDDRAALRPGARLDGPRPVAHVGVAEPGERHLDPTEAVWVADVGDLRGRHPGQRGGRAVAAAVAAGQARGQAEQRALLAPAHGERGGVAGVGLVDVPGRREGVLAVERFAGQAEADGGARPQPGVAPGHAFQLGEGAGDLLGHGLGGGVDLGLGPVR